VDTTHSGLYRLYVDVPSLVTASDDAVSEIFIMVIGQRQWLLLLLHHY